MGSIFAAVRRMTEGELEVFGRDPLRATEDDCLRLADRKTAALFAATCTGPTFLMGNGASVHRDALHRYGTLLGVAFQVVDDILDIAQPPSVLGKPSCGDIVEGKRTLPIPLYASTARPGRTETAGRHGGARHRRHGTGLGRASP